MSYLVIIFYFITLGYVFVFSLVQLYLTFSYLKGRKTRSNPQNNSLHHFPVVTIQLPVFNEKYVINRLLTAISEIDYPKNKLEIQVLDDSTDETTELAEQEVSKLRKRGFDAYVLHRSDRQGYKAGALNIGLQQAKGELIAIFDADFLPDENFLRQVLPSFGDPKLGMVQTKWSHINKDFGLFTRLQAFGLDAHFSIEQNGRYHANAFINFNGTGGVWRKSCILDAGGWEYDTLTEDLDLSYRAQLKGWKFRFLEEVKSPSELPILMSAIKSQQFRWNKGAAETGRKLIGKVWRSGITTKQKILGTFHLYNSSVYLFLFIASLLSVPMLYIKYENPDLLLYFHLASIFVLGFISISIFYWTSTKISGEKRPFNYYLRHFPLFVSYTMGLSLHNANAVFQGFTGIKSGFIRTPKFNVISQKDRWKNNSYLSTKFNLQPYLEILLALYFLGGIILGIQINDYGLLLFHILMATGFLMVGLSTLVNFRHVSFRFTR